MKFDFDPVNDRLYTISDILDHEIRADETLMGNFVSDYDDDDEQYTRLLPNDGEGSRGS